MKKSVVVTAMGAVLFCSLSVLASDSRVNPTNGHIESVTEAGSGSHVDVEFSDDPGLGAPTTTWIATTSNNERAPRIEIDSSNDTWVTYWSDESIHEIYLHKKDGSTGTWGSALAMNYGTDSVRRPELARFGSDVWIAFEADISSGFEIVVGVIQDDVDPLTGYSVLDSLPASQNADLKLHVESGYLWATWIEGGDSVGWSEYDSSNDSWSSVNSESYANDTVVLARKRVKEDVVP